MSECQAMSEADGTDLSRIPHFFVIPAKAGISWIVHFIPEILAPAFAGACIKSRGNNDERGLPELRSVPLPLTPIFLTPAPYGHVLYARPITTITTGRMSGRRLHETR